MKCNIGRIDRVIRLVIGLSILSLGLYFKSWFGLIGFIPILTAMIRWCPMYSPFGISTCKKD